MSNRFFKTMMALTTAAVLCASLVAFSTERREADRLVTVRVAAGCIGCSEACTGDAHKTFAGTGWIGAIHQCWSNTGDCSDNHPKCQPEDDHDVEEVSVEEAVYEFFTAAPTDIERLLTKYRGVASFNQHRQSIILLGCDELNYVANIPLTEAQLDALLTE